MPALRARLHRRLAIWLMLLLVGANAALPRDLVCCFSTNARPAFELALNGRCLGSLDPDRGHCHAHGAVHSDNETAVGPAPGSCEDIAVRSSEGLRSSFDLLDGLSAQPAVLAEVAPPCLSALSTAPQFRPPLPAHADCGPPLRLTGTVLLRI